MKKLILKVIALIALTNIVVQAESNPYVFNTKSLIAVEGSYGVYDVKNDDVPALNENINFTGIGLKVGAQTDNYRLFLSGRYNVISEFDYAYLFGAEAQYLLNFSSFANLFLGINGGYADLRLVDSQNDTRDFDSVYVGGDVGFNIHLSKSVDFEIGGRIMSLLDSTSVIDDNAIVYTFDNKVTGYASIIFKYDMD